MKDFRILGETFCSTFELLIWGIAIVDERGWAV